MSVTNKAQIEAYIGSTGSGKGVSIKVRLVGLCDLPLIIWDPRDEYGAQAVKVTAAGLVEAGRKIKAGQGRGVRVRFVHDGKSNIAKAFAMVCDVAFRAGNCVFMAEELSDVTTASLAPPEWKRCITQGRHQGLVILGAAQRPALIDKTFLGNCTYIRCFMLRYAADRKAMAEAMDVDPSIIQDLATTDDEDEGRPVIKTVIKFHEKDFRKNVTQPGTIRLQKRRDGG